MIGRAPARVFARLVFPILLSLCFITLTSVGARAALWLILSASTASPGDVVLGNTPGRYSPGQGAVAAARSELLPLFLVPTTQVEGVGSADDPRLAHTGWLSVDSSGNGHAIIIVPTLSPGAYTLMVKCEACAPTSAGRSILPVAEITVTPVGDEAPASLLGALVDALVRGLCHAGR